MPKKMGPLPGDQPPNQKERKTSSGVGGKKGGYNPLPLLLSGLFRWGEKDSACSKEYRISRVEQAAGKTLGGRGSNGYKKREGGPVVQ